MLPLGEFIDRLEEGKETLYLNYRPCDSEVEKQTERVLMGKVRDAMYERNMHPTFRTEYDESKAEI